MRTAWILVWMPLSIAYCSEAPPATGTEAPASPPPGEAATTKTAPPHQHYWESMTEPRGFVGAAYLWQDKDEPLQGLRISSGLVNEFPYKRGVIRRNEFETWLSQRGNDEQAIWSGGLGFDSPYVLATGPLRVLPRGTVGLEYRTESPDHGLGAFVGAGLSVEVWVSRDVAISFGIERQFSYPGGDNNQLGINLRFVSHKLPALIPMV